MEDDYFCCDYTDKQEPIKTDVYDMIQDIHILFFFFFLHFGTPNSRVSGFLLHTPLRVANLPQLCLRNHSPFKSMTEVTEITKGNFTVKSIEFSPLPINAMPISYFTSRFKTCLAGEDRVCTQLPINMS